MESAWCESCGGFRVVVEESDEQIGHEEQAREVRVMHLDCGHSRALRWTGREGL